MNDPHVVSMIYHILKGDKVDFDKAQPLTVSRKDFTVKVDKDEAFVTMTCHFASEKEARAVVDPFFAAWESWDDLNELNDLRFEFGTARITDRNPSPNTIYVAGGSARMRVGAVMIAQGNVSRLEWPNPPQDIAISSDALSLRDRWIRYRKNRESLLSAAYFALTVMEGAGGGRKGAVSYYNIEYDVLKKLGELTSNRGGDNEARKADGRSQPLSLSERDWVKEAFEALVMRAAERAYYGSPPPRQLAMSGLPNL